MRPFPATLILCALFTFAGPAIAAPHTPASPSVTAGRAVDGDSLVLSDGTILRLAGIEAPRLAPGWPVAKAWPLADAAKAALANLTAGQRLTLRPLAPPRDRLGRLDAWAFDDAGHFVQAEMVGLGLARVHVLAEAPAPLPPGRDAARLFASLLASEAQARAAGLGIWALPFYRVLDPKAAAGLGDGYRIVTGRIATVRVAKHATYLDFGPDWRHTLAIAVPARARRGLAHAGIDLAALGGRQVRVRGWVRTRPVPEMALSHSEQIEILGQ